MPTQLVSTRGTQHTLRHPSPVTSTGKNAAGGKFRPVVGKHRKETLWHDTGDSPTALSLNHRHLCLQHQDTAKDQTSVQASRASSCKGACGARGARIQTGPMEQYEQLPRCSGNAYSCPAPCPQSSFARSVLLVLHRSLGRFSDFLHK